MGNVPIKIGILKAKFPILHNGFKHRCMIKCAKAIQALCAIHNFILENKGSVDVGQAPAVDPHQQNDPYDPEVAALEIPGARKTSENICEMHF